MLTMNTLHEKTYFLGHKGSVDVNIFIASLATSLDTSKLSVALPRMRVQLEKNVYYPGETIQGVAIVGVSEEKQLFVSLSVVGFSRVSWLSTNLSGFGVQYEKSCCLLYESCCLNSRTGDIQERPKSAWKPNKGGIFHFRYTLPLNLAPSIQHARGNYVKYYLALSVEEGGKRKRKEIPFWILSHPLSFPINLLSSSIPYFSDSLNHVQGIEMAVQGPSTMHLGELNFFAIRISSTHDNLRCDQIVDYVTFKLECTASRHGSCCGDWQSETEVFTASKWTFNAINASRNKTRGKTYESPPRTDQEAPSTTCKAMKSSEPKSTLRPTRTSPAKGTAHLSPTSTLNPATSTYPPSTQSSYPSSPLRPSPPRQSRPDGTSPLTRDPSCRASEPFFSLDTHSEHFISGRKDTWTFPWRLQEAKQRGGDLQTDFWLPLADLCPPTAPPHLSPLLQFSYTLTVRARRKGRAGDETLAKVSFPAFLSSTGPLIPPLLEATDSVSKERFPSWMKPETRLKAYTTHFTLAHRYRHITLLEVSQHSSRRIREGCIPQNTTDGRNINFQYGRQRFIKGGPIAPGGGGAFFIPPHTHRIHSSDRKGHHSTLLRNHWVHGEIPDFISLSCPLSPLTPAHLSFGTSNTIPASLEIRVSRDAPPPCPGENRIAL